jgi:hypothetical protein
LRRGEEPVAEYLPPPIKSKTHFDAFAEPGAASWSQ